MKAKEKQTVKEKFSFELRRKAVHILGVAYILIYWFVAVAYGHLAGIFALFFAYLVMLALEFVRLELKVKIPFVHKLWREKEQHTFGGQIYLIFGVIIAFGFFEFTIATAAILMALFGDMAAALIGIRFGKHTIKTVPQKTWEGAIAELVVNCIIGFIFLESIAVILIMAFVATAVETFVTDIDDNLTIPVFAGGLGQLARILLT